jgi:hypothetical protein
MKIVVSLLPLSLFLATGASASPAGLPELPRDDKTYSEPNETETRVPSQFAVKGGFTSMLVDPKK